MLRQSVRIWATTFGLMTLAGFAGSGTASAQNENITLLGQRDAYSFHSGVWGFSHANGTELAIIGTQNGASFVDVTNPAAPVEVAFITGPSSTWREIRCWNNYAYISTEGGGGLNVVDLTNPLAPVRRPDYTASFSSCHSLHLDEQTGILWCNGTNNGLVGLNLANPAAPVEVKRWSGSYVHDMYSRNGIGYLAEIFDSRFGIVNLAGPAYTFSVYSNTSYPGASTHNMWLTEDSKYLCTTDETTGGHLKIWDVQNPAAPFQVGEWIDPDDPDVIIHNVYVKGSYAYASNYRAGLRMWDISNPADPKRIAQYDTYPGGGSGYDGAWGVYPFANSGNIYISDMQTGLYIFQFTPNFGLAEGTVTQTNNGNVLGGVTVRAITDDDKTTTTNPAGFYHINLSLGTQTLEFSKFGYLTQTHDVTITAGGTDTENVTLDLLATGSISGFVRHQVGGAAIAGATVSVVGTPLSTTSAANGSYSFATVPTGAYTLEATKFGFGRTQVPFDVTANQATSRDLFLRASLFADNAEIAAGWTIGNAPGDNATTGLWVLADPVGTGGGGVGVQPEDDYTPSPGVKCYVTGNGAIGGGVGEADVDGGKTTLITPTINLALAADPTLQYRRWYTNNSGSNPGTDFWVVEISSNGGTNWVTLENSLATRNFWELMEFRVRDYITLTNNIKIRFIANDTGGGSVVEAAIDDLEIFDQTVPTGIDTPTPDLVGARLLTATPNPMFGSTTLRFQLPIATRVSLDIIDVQGRLLRRVVDREVAAGEHGAVWDGRDTDGAQAAPGVYFQRFSAGGKSSSQKLVVIR